MAISFTVYGNPFGWQRAGQNHKTGAVYTQPKTKAWEQTIAYAYKALCGPRMFPTKTPLALTVYAYIPIPKSASETLRAQMLSGEVRPTVKPDGDNIAKLVADALNGIAYDDDKCIVDWLSRKFYSDDPRTEITIEIAPTA